MSPNNSKGGKVINYATATTTALHTMLRGLNQHERLNESLNTEQTERRAAIIAELNRRGKL